ncbi:MAG: hypothetical protein KME26_07950 [Oscillatoria princeps RMCB-10]|jgi:hypothetical protein|nr:hypothetical protein [Oscillatoria princeps RMCB-10]
MSSIELLTIDPANALILKAFLKALAQLDSFPQALQPDLKQLAIAIANGETKLAADLEDIATTNESLNQLFQDEYSRMLLECESEGERPGRRTNQVELDPTPPYLGNVAAEILSSDDPSKSAQKNSDKLDQAPPLLDPTIIVTP